MPVFSIAKRSLMRRRLRFALTLTSITVLVTSFVALTSFSEGYGLIISRIPGDPGSSEGVLLRAGGYIEKEPVFLPQDDFFSGWLERQDESRVVSAKAENLPFTLEVAILNRRPIWGVLGFDPATEPSIVEMGDALIEGQLPSEDGVAISENLREALGVRLGDSLSLNGVKFELEGVFDDSSLKGLIDFDGSLYISKKLVNLDPDGEVPNFVVEPCDPSEVVVVHLQTALSMPLVGISRVGILAEEGVDEESFAERLALERGYWAWSIVGGTIDFVRLGSYFQGRGLSLVVPWGIVVLNVVVTVLNSLYERRREIHILSSVGLNPAQISAVFVAEALMIGLIAGGLGYLAGLGLYKGMSLLRYSMEVHQKISAYWNLAAIGISMTAVLTGALAALKSSVVITPSLRRRWEIEEGEYDLLKPWEITLPVRLLREEAGGFVSYVVDALRRLENHPVMCTSSIKQLDVSDGVPMRVDFVYKAATPMDNLYTKNTLVLEEGQEPGLLVVSLRSTGEQKWAHATGSLLRNITMRWSTYQRGGRVEPDSP